MGALLQLLHEAAHSMLSKSKQVNERIARWFCALPVGVNFEGYVLGHLRHHAYTGTENEPETDYEKYRVSDIRSPFLYLLLLKDLTVQLKLKKHLLIKKKFRLMLKNKNAL